MCCVNVVIYFIYLFYLFHSFISLFLVHLFHYPLALCRQCYQSRFWLLIESHFYYYNFISAFFCFTATLYIYINIMVLCFKNLVVECNFIEIFRRYLKMADQVFFLYIFFILSFFLGLYKWYLLLFLLAGKQHKTIPNYGSAP